MVRHPFISLLRDLVQALPQRARAEWTELADIDPNRPTVILVSGFGASERALTIVRKRLARDGFNVLVLAMDWQALSDGVRGLYRLAERLSSLVLRVRKDGGLGKTRIYLVAHSAGGLVARYYVQLLGGSHYCDGLITLATPHSGTWLAALGFVSHLVLKARCLFHMLPISPFIKRMNAAAFPAGFRMVSIYSKDDMLCPESATRLPFSFSGNPEIQAVALSRLSHGDFLLSKVTYRILSEYLKSPTANHATSISSRSTPALEQ